MKKAKIVVSLLTCLTLFIGIVINLIDHKRFDGNFQMMLKDWQNYTEMEAAFKLNGFGQMGRAADFTEYHQELYDKYGYDALLSDALPLQRSVPDVRPEACKSLRYLSQLPRATVIIIFHNERLSVLLRTVYSILNRSPCELLEEIILVDDGSTWPDMHDELEMSLKIHLLTENDKVRLIRQAKRTGIMSARNAGARQSSVRSKVLIFLDSHFEVGYNWLPPLLEPIVIEPRTCACPIIDRIAYDTFAYTANSPWRGYLDYYLNYHRIALKPQMQQQPAKNFKNYVMMGGAMAIGKDFFWDLGGFDDGMMQWGGEQIEMSLKIWMCGGQLIDVPCSRAAHLFRDVERTQANRHLYANFSFLPRNYKRLLYTWIEPEQRRYFLDKMPQLKNIDAGDLQKQQFVRRKLNCSSFAWMLENVMPDMHELFLPIEPADLASGLIRSMHNPMLCIAMVGGSPNPILVACPTQNERIAEHMKWHYTWLGGGNQKWYYDRQFQWLKKLDENLCMLANEQEAAIQLAGCDVDNLKLKWKFSHVNESEMEKRKAKILKN